MAKQNLTQIRCVNPKQKVRLEYTLHKESRNIRVENILSTVFRSLFFKNSWIFNVLRIGERVALIGAFLCNRRWRVAGVVERGSLENRCPRCIPRVLILS